ncbi:unnamed protein product [Acanthosepion pharaonis]|uniref:Uncharacterized protein n=1 Tax=Acanthosepion pharaonis TaxID=158019 RepID=A0A812B3B0_ACAPH|nr:unnamed protein product [Sepia pharaonis]
MLEDQTQSSDTTLTRSWKQQTSQTLPESSAQVHSHNVSIPLDYFTWRSAVPSQTDSKHKWLERDAVHVQEKTGMFKFKTTLDEDITTFQGVLNIKEYSKYISEQRQLIAPSYQVNSWPHPVPHMPTNDKVTDTLLSGSRQQLTSESKSQGSSDITSQMYTQNISIPPDYFTWRSAISSQNEAERDWTEADKFHGQEKTDLSSKFSSPFGQLNKSNISHPEMNHQQTPNARPLPPVPHLN